MSDADTKLLERAIDEASRKKSHYYYSAALEARVVAASEATHTITIEFTAVDSISSAGYLDEGFVGTVADY
ncbi:hypothetical protein EDC05_002613 [Coemansia umbellata]|nr:hypothetical protein EDC05_002613 [Coemansia umbellata]